MTNPSLLVPILISALFSSAGSAQPSPFANAYWGDTERGWFWYEDPAIEYEQSAMPPPTTRSESVQRQKPEIVEFKRLQRRLEEYRSVAIINPTEANVRRYMELEAASVKKASLFADVAQRLAWSTPELDLSLQGRPVNAKAIDVFDREEANARTRTVSELATDHVLFFFFRSDCPYCQAFAPIIEAFETRYGMQVVAVSLDGGSLPGFPVPRIDNGISRTLNVTHVPATFLAQPATGQIVPVGFGVLSESQLLERIALLSNPAPSTTVPSATKRASLP